MVFWPYLLISPVLTTNFTNYCELHEFFKTVYRPPAGGLVHFVVAAGCRILRRNRHASLVVMAAGYSDPAGALVLVLARRLVRETGNSGRIRGAWNAFVRPDFPICPTGADPR